MTYKKVHSYSENVSTLLYDIQMKLYSDKLRHDLSAKVYDSMNRNLLLLLKNNFRECVKHRILNFWRIYFPMLKKILSPQNMIIQHNKVTTLKKFETKNILLIYACVSQCIYDFKRLPINSIATRISLIIPNCNSRGVISTMKSASR